MVTIASTKLAALMNDRGASRVASEVGVSEVTLRSHRDGKSAPRSAAVAAYERVGIAADDWTTPVTFAAPPVVPLPPLPTIPAEGASPDELRQALVAAQGLFRSAEASSTDRLRALNVAVTALAAMIRNPRPRHVAEYQAFTELGARLEACLAPFTEARDAVAGVLRDFDDHDPGAVEDPCTPLTEIVALADRMIASNDTASRDRAGAAGLKVRAAKILDRLDDNPRTAADWPELRARVIDVLKSDPKALAAVASAMAAP